jgi:hypothetical protein
MLSDLLAEAVALVVILVVSAGGIGFVAGWWARGNL